MSLLEFSGSPVDVTAREVLFYTFDLTPWLAENETVGAVTVRLDDGDGNTIRGAASTSWSSGAMRPVEVQWSRAGILMGRTYYLCVQENICQRKEAGFACCEGLPI